MSYRVVPAPTHPTLARDHATALAVLASDLAAFLDAAELPADLEREAAFFLNGLCHVLQAVVERIATAGPG